MATNLQAAERIRENMRDLTLVLRTNTALSTAQKTNLRATIDQLDEEYLDALGRPRAKTYRDIANRLASAKAGLDQIAAERKELQVKLVTARKLLGSIRAVFSLLA